MKKLILIRGISGSGKSTKAKKIYDEILFDPDNSNEITSGLVTIIEADDYFKSGKEYRFNASFLSDAHTYCRLRVKQAMTIVGCRNIIVSNTFTQLWEMKEYAEMAIKYGYSVEICESDVEWRYNVDECFKRNVHNVPYDTIKKQMDRFVGLKHGTYDTDKIKEIFGI